ncbi:hypothetical protein PACTADRAFT_15132 [Pachysolen tannophilus NRRL Y-2460]|uniref:C2H2-type domain-containing protein n=1 Tax=Pachysolen tannophilus NRRL Y-2460 TaxID=669874 RepID=A0A1E4TXX5_PACTA|nr:hypothetical protein PACTADRAFT_15132 [Pachysolen tannophilus NRRL Y-2460]
MGPTPKKHICSFCARCFSRHEHRLRHEKIHTKEKPFDCKICSSAFARRDLLQRHCRTVHGVTLKSNSHNGGNGNGSGSGSGSGGMNGHLNDQGFIHSTVLDAKMNGGGMNANSNGTGKVFSVTTLINDGVNSPSARIGSAGSMGVPGVPGATGAQSGAQSSAQSGAPPGAASAQHQQNSQNSHHQTYSASSASSSSSSSALALAATGYTIDNSDILKAIKQPSTSNIPQNILTEKNIISVLTLCKKFNYLTYPYQITNPLCNYFLIYATRCHNILPLFKFDRIINLTERNELLYIILCVGANENNCITDAIKLFNKSWSIIMDKINSDSIDYNSENIDEFVENVIMLCYVYFDYFDNYFDQIFLKENIAVDIDTLFAYLNNVIITQILNEGKVLNNGVPLTIYQLSERIFPVRLNYWHAFIIISQYSYVHKAPVSILHSFLLNKILPIEDGQVHSYSLADVLKNLTVSANLYKYNKDINGEPSGSKLFKKLGLIDRIIINSLLNEFRIMLDKDCNVTHFDKLSTSYPVVTTSFFSGNRNFLHNSIILANKSFSFENNDSANQQQNNQFNISQTIGLLNDGVQNLTVFSKNDHQGSWTVSNKLINNLPYIQFLNMLILVKRKIMINCPLKFVDLISNYLFLPKDQFNWIMLSLTLKEFNYQARDEFNNKGERIARRPFILQDYINLRNDDTKILSVDDITKNITNFIEQPFPSTFIINNNIGVTMLPTLALSFVNLNNTLVDCKNFLSLPSSKKLIIGFLIENFLTIIRILVNYRYRLFNLSNDSFKTSGSYNSSDSLILSLESFLENPILGVILYFLDEAGINVASELIEQRKHNADNNVDRNTKFQRRSNSINVAEFISNSEKIRSKNITTDLQIDADFKTPIEYPPLSKILSQDLKYYHYLKNFEIALINWLNIFVADPAVSNINLLIEEKNENLDSFKNFVKGLKKAMQQIYETLDLRDPETFTHSFIPTGTETSLSSPVLDHPVARQRSSSCIDEKPRLAKDNCGASSPISAQTKPSGMVYDNNQNANYINNHHQYSGLYNNNIINTREHQIPPKLIFDRAYGAPHDHNSSLSQLQAKHNESLTIKNRNQFNENSNSQQKIILPPILPNGSASKNISSNLIDSSSFKYRNNNDNNINNSSSNHNDHENGYNTGRSDNKFATNGDHHSLSNLSTTTRGYHLPPISSSVGNEKTNSNSNGNSVVAPPIAATSLTYRSFSNSSNNDDDLSAKSNTDSAAKRQKTNIPISYS